MATGQGQGGGVFSWPDVPELGYETWAEMSGIHPGHALVGGSSGRPGYEGGQRSVALASPAPTQAVESGAPTASHWSQVFNLRGNPIGWVLILAIFYLGISSIHLSASASGRLGR